MSIDFTPVRYTLIHLDTDVWLDESFSLLPLKEAVQNQREPLVDFMPIVLSHVVPYDAQLWLARDQEGYPLFLGFDGAGRLSVYVPWREDFVGPGPELRLIKRKRERIWKKVAPAP